MNRGISGYALLGLFLLCACKKATTKSPPPGASSSASASARASAPNPPNIGAGAFDLVATESGAALVFASAASAQLSLTLYDAAGHVRRSEPLFVDTASAGSTGARIGEVAAVARGGELAVAWIEEAGASVRSRAVVRSITESGSAANVVEIGPVFPPVSRPRGNVAITSTNDRFLVLARGQKTDCIAQAENDCVGYDFHRLEAGRTERQSLPLAVPLPCDQNSVSFAVTGSRWYYGVCSRATGKPVTTLFSIQTDPEYARADRILEGCLPLGALAQGGDLLVVGDCGGERRGVRMHGGNAESSELRVDRVDALCDAGRPLLRQLGPNGIQLSLDRPRDRLEGFLPQNVAPANARAIWTGQTLLVATPQNGSVTLKGYQCDSTLLREVALAQR